MPLPTHSLSKTTFMYGCQCHKRLWLHKKKPSLKDAMSVEQEQRFEQGTNVGLLAQSLFPNGVDASPPNPWSYKQSVADTAKYIRNGHQIIYEAAFQYKGILCAVDILIKTAKGWVAYEVKSSLSVKDTHIDDAALQYHVLSNSEIILSDFAIVHLNKNYIRQGALELRKLFYPVSVLQKILPLQSTVAKNAEVFQSLLLADMVPDVVVGDQCFSPFPCDFLQHCHQGLFKIPEAVPAPPIINFEYPVHFLEIGIVRNAVPQKDGDWPYKSNIISYKISKQSSQESITDVLREEFEQNNLDSCLEMINALQDAAMIVVQDKRQVYYLLEDLKKAMPQEKERIVVIQQKLIN